jgi:hypothetical protein
MWTFEQVGIMKNSSTPRSFSMTDCDEMVSQRKSPIHSLRKYQKSILDMNIIFWNYCNLCLTRVAENVAAV